MRQGLKKNFNYFIFLILLLLLIALSSCQKKSKSYLDGEIETIKLEGITMYVDDPNFFISKIICKHHSTLYMESEMYDTLINVYRISADSLILIDKFLNKGQGPYEFSVFGSLYDKEMQTLSFFENSGVLTKGYIIDLKSDSSIYNKSSWKRLDFSKMEKARMGDSFAYISDTLLLAIGGEAGARDILSVINLNDEKSYTPLSFWPNDGFEDNIYVKQGVYMNNAKVFKNHSLRKYLYVCGLGKYMELFNIVDGQIIDQSPICEIYPKYEVRDDNLNYKGDENDINQGYRVYVTDSLIYAIPMEYTLNMLRNRETYKGYPCSYGEKIDVFDWSGNFVKRYELDTPVLSFIVDENDHIIYTITDDLETGDSIVRDRKSVV